jgi:hypothetical protein
MQSARKHTTAVYFSNFYDVYRLAFSLEHVVFKHRRFNDRLEAVFNLFRQASIELSIPTKPLYQGVHALPDVGVFYTWEDPVPRTKKSDWNMVSAKLSKADKAAFDKQVATWQKAQMDPIGEIASKGYSIKLTWVDKSSAWCVSATGKDDHPKNPRSTLVSWSDSYLEAVWMTIYKIEIVFDNGTWDDEDGDSWG